MDNIIYLTFLAIGLFFTVILPSFAILHIFFPKDILRKYFGKPFFQDWEVSVFGKFPATLIRTAMFLWIIAWPKFGTKRKIGQARSDSPIWLQIASRIFYVFFFFIWGGGAALLIAMFVGLLIIDF